VFDAKYFEFCMAFSSAHDESFIKKSNISFIVNLNYTDTKLECHTKSGLNSGTLIVLKMQLLVEIYPLLGVLNAVLKKVIAGLLLLKSFILEITYNCAKKVMKEKKKSTE